MFRALLQQAVNNQVLFDYILSDNWFGSKANMNFIYQALEKLFIIGIKSNRCVALTKHDADRIYEVYQKRWRFEEYHKSMKQNASLSKSPTKTILGLSAIICLHQSLHTANLIC